MIVVALVPGAGMGRRIGPSARKPFFEIGGLPIMAHTLKLLQSITAITEIIPILRDSDMEDTLALMESYGIDKVRRIASGGAERQDSVYNGLKLLKDGTDIVLVHDAVRPFASRKMVEEIIQVASTGTGAVPGVPVKDTIKEIDDGGIVSSTLQRNRLIAVQTPQAFPCVMLQKAYDQAAAEGFLATDDAALVEHMGECVKVVEGSYENIKITTIDDLVLAESILQRKGLRGKERTED